jgi:hypothetical protein
MEYMSGLLPRKPKWPKHGADYSIPFSSSVKNRWRYTSTPSYVIIEHMEFYTKQTLHEIYTTVILSSTSLSASLTQQNGWESDDRSSIHITSGSPLVPTPSSFSVKLFISISWSTTRGALPQRLLYVSMVCCLGTGARLFGPFFSATYCMRSWTQDSYCKI